MKNILSKFLFCYPKKKEKLKYPFLPKEYSSEKYSLGGVKFIIKD